MARPKKDPGDKRDKRVTVYLTGKEEKMLNVIAESTGLSKNNIISKAMDQYVSTLEDPPPRLRKEKLNEIMSMDEERVRGYICTAGHPLWLEWTWPSPPNHCPCCGMTDFKETWTGVVKRDFR